MFKIAFIDLFNSGNYGVRCLSSFLKLHDFKVINIYAENYLQDFNRFSNKQIGAVENLIITLNPDLIGFSMLSVFCHDHYIKLAARIKTITKAPIIVGGPYPSVAPDFILKEPCIDYICIGEGEESLLEMCRLLDSGKSVEKVPGILSKYGSEYVRRDPPQNLDILPYPDISMSDLYVINRNGSISEVDPASKVIQYHPKASRGCIYSCSYCCNERIRGLYSSSCKYYRIKSVQRIIDELQQYKNKNCFIKRLFFIDDTFPFMHSWIEEFCEEYKNKIGLPFSVWMNPTTINRENIALLRYAGLYMVVMGIQSASDVTRNLVFNRIETKEHILRSDQLLSEYGIAKHYDFLIGHPWEDKDELKDILDLLMKCKGQVYSVAMHSLAFFEGTALEEHAVKEGIIKREENFKNLTIDSLTMVRNYLWTKGVPKSYDVIKRNKIALIYLLTGPFFWPKILIKFLSRLIFYNNRVFALFYNFLLWIPSRYYFICRKLTFEIIRYLNVRENPKNPTKTQTVS